MRKPIRASSINVLSPLTIELLIAKEALIITIKKIPSRVFRVPVDTSEAESWRQFIMTGK
jgi:hypothetical protein